MSVKSPYTPKQPRQTSGRAASRFSWFSSLLVSPRHRQRMEATLNSLWGKDVTNSPVAKQASISNDGHLRVYISISSEGYGHSSRALSMAPYFKEDELLIGSYGYARERVEAFGHPVVSVPQEYQLIGDSGSVDLSKTLVKNHDRPLKLHQIVQREMDIMVQYGVTLVVADGRIAPVLAASKLQLPCLVMTNQSEYYPFFKDEDSPLVQLFGRSFEVMMQWWLSSAEEIIIPDFKPPYTVCLPNLSDEPQVKKRSRFVGPMVTFNPDTVEGIKREALGLTHNKPLVVVALGGHAYRRPVFDAMLSVADAYPEWQFVMLTSFPRPAGCPKNVLLCQPPGDAVPYFKSADLVVTQGGHSTAMELLALGKTSVVVPDANQTEQQNNARRLEALGVSKCIPHGQHLPERLIKALEESMHSTAMQANAEHMKNLACEQNGAKAAAQVVRHYAERLIAY